MSEYKTIFGKAVKALASDPTDAGAEGQIWYNTTTGSFRTVLSSGAWTSSANLPTGRDYGTAGGIQTAGFIAGGELGPGTAINTTFDYDGSSWTASGAMGTTRLRMNLGVSGTQTAGLGVGGHIPPSTVYSAVEEYNGSIWTAGTSLPVATQQSGGAGPETSYMMLGTPSDRSEGLSYNGSAWSAEGSSSEGFAYGALAGQETAALAFYGATSPAGTPRGTGEEYNGTAWTTIVPSLPNQGNSGGAGGTTSAAVFAGAGTTARYWNGTTVAATTSMATPRANYGSIGGPPGIFVAAGGNGDLSATEEFSFSIYSPVAATWASGATMNTQGTNSGGFGTMSAGALASTGPGTGYETYDGSTWTAQPSLNTTRTGGTAGAGSISAGLAAGGGTPTVSSANSEEYNGSSWSEGNNLGTARGALASANSGSQTAALAFSGETNPGGTLRAQTEAYDGTSWTEQNDLSDARFGGAGAGTQTAGLMMGGNPTTPGFSTATEEYNGTSWTSGGALNTGRRDLSGAGNGTQTSALVYGGEASPGFTTATEEYNGTAWSNTANLATAAGVRSGFNSGGNTAAIAAGPSLSTEEYTGVTQVLDYKTISDS